MFRFFAPLFTELDKVTTTFARDVSSQVIVALTPIVSAGLVLYFIVWGILVMRGVVEEPVLEFLGKVVRMALIVSVALGAGFYQGTIADLVQGLPDDLAAVVTGTDAGGKAGEAALMDRAAGEGLSKAEDAFEKGGILTQQGIAFTTFGVLILLATVVMVGVGGAMILVAKVVLSLLAALGPLFIAALLFEGTKGFFDRWLAMVASYGLVIVLFACAFTFMLGIFANYMDGVALDGTMNVAYGIGGALVLTLVSVAVLKELHHLAVGLGGGYAHRIRPFAGIVAGIGAGLGLIVEGRHAQGPHGGSPSPRLRHGSGAEGTRREPPRPREPGRTAGGGSRRNAGQAR